MNTRSFFDTLIDHLGAVLSAERLADKLFVKKLIAKDILDKAKLPSLIRWEFTFLLFFLSSKLNHQIYRKFLQFLVEQRI